MPRETQQPSPINQPTEISTSNVEPSKSFAFESFDDSLRRFQRLREIRKNLRTKYDDHSHGEPSKSEEITEPVNIPVERINPSPSPVPDPTIVELYDQTANKVKMNDRRYRSRTLEHNQMQSVDNQIYGCTSSKSKDNQQHRSESQKHRSNRLSFRRSSEDIQDKQLQLRRHAGSANSNETWMEIGQEHWTNLLENGWRPTVNTSGVTLVSFADAGRSILFEIFI